MKKLFLFCFVGLIFLMPGIVFGSIASDFTINNQSTYSIPPNTTNLLILDLTLPMSVEGETLQVESIKINNAGTAQHSDVSKMVVWEDGLSAGWDGDEIEISRITTSPWWDTVITGDFSEYGHLSEAGGRRIFVTVDIYSNAVSERTIKPQLVVGTGDGVAIQFVSATSTNGPVDANVVGFERTILTGIDIPSSPVSPLRQTPEVISDTVIRWHFLDLSNNEFGFKILDSNLSVVAKSETADLSYIDETGLIPNTEYSGRRVVAFNDMGQSDSLLTFQAVYTLEAEEEVIEEDPIEEPVEEEESVEEEEVIEEEEITEIKPISEMTVVELKNEIAGIQQQIIILITQLIQLFQSQLTAN